MVFVLNKLFIFVQYHNEFAYIMCLYIIPVYVKSSLFLFSDNIGLYPSIFVCAVFLFGTSTVKSQSI